MEKERTSYFITGVLFCLAGAILFSTKAVLVKLAYRDTNVDAVSLLALRMIFSLPFFVVSALFASSQSSNVRFTRRQWVQVALVGCLGYYISSLLDFLGLQYVSAGIERLILFIYPTLVLIMSAIFFRIHIKPIQWLAVIITYAGLATAFFGEVSFTESPGEKFYLGTFYIFLCAITYASYVVGSGKLIPAVGAAKFNSYAMTFACIGVIIHFLVVSDASLFGLSSTAYLYGVAMAVFSTVVPSFLITEGIKRVGASNAAIIGSVGPISTIIQAAILLGEPVFALQIVGTFLVVIGVLMVGRKEKEPRPA